VAGALRVGVQLPEVERTVRWPEYVAMARSAEDVGFDSVWVGDHLLYRDDGLPERGPWEAWTLLAGLATVTQRVAIGPLVTCTAFHLPGVLAKVAATVDEMSGGRLVLGLGAGWNEIEFRAFGIPFDRRASRFEEAFEIIRGLLAGRRVTFHGRYHRLEDAVLSPRPGRRIPLMVGSTGDRILATTLPHVEAWNTWYEFFGNTPEGFAADSAKATAAARTVGRDPSTIVRSAAVLVLLDPDSDERPLMDDVPPIEGPMNRVARRLEEFGEAGADEVILILSPITEASIRAVGPILDRLKGGTAWPT
jgi:alkanesulfonate monooxygenase SsuD/methylene tetrahydromethanopterin reductase-like flavin-dependent oxidoreductase (luciferase family)